MPVHGVGKIRDLFAGVGIDAKHEGATNAKGIAVDHARCSRELDAGLIFVNLVETDQVYGHRHDVEGFHGALREIDAAVAGWLELLGEDDLLVLTADHGVDPDAPHTDHTREYAPLLAVFEGHGGRRHDGPLADVGASALRWLTGRDAPGLPGDAVRLTRLRSRGESASSADPARAPGRPTREATAELAARAGGRGPRSSSTAARDVGLMGALADAVLAEGGEVTGVIPRALVDKEIAHDGLSDLRVVGSMHERKALMADLSDAFVALPGGLGHARGAARGLYLGPARPAPQAVCAARRRGLLRSPRRLPDHAVGSASCARSTGRC